MRVLVVDDDRLVTKLFLLGSSSLLFMSKGIFDTTSPPNTLWPEQTARSAGKFWRN